MLAQQRHKWILDQLERKGIVHTSELVRDLRVSSETVRKDLDSLEQAGSLVRVHGGAVPADQRESPYVSFQVRNEQNMERKAAIAARAAELVEENQVVALDYGSTSQLMAMELKRRFRRLTVITNSIHNVLILSECPEFTVIMAGGVLNREEMAFENDFSPILEGLHIDVLFMTVSGIHPKVGCTDQSFGASRIQNQMRRAAGRTVVLADSSKFGKASLVKICALSEVSRIITDSGLEPALAREICDAGVELETVRTEE